MPLAACRQLLQVIAADWDSNHGQLQRFMRQSAADAWHPVGAAFPVSLGRNGLAWGQGLHGDTSTLGRQKQEGDGCAPAGIFALPSLFGNAPSSPNSRLPYRANRRELKAIDDPASRFYNQIVDASGVARDWQSHEEMWRDDERYAIGAVIAHNAAAHPGAGSCIFLHVWAAPGVPTAGCTAGDYANILDICTWLDGTCAPRLVQLPWVEYQAHQQSWCLPALAGADNGRPAS